MNWEWHVQGFYANDVKHPKQPNSLAIDIGGVTREALSMDISVLKEREDIGTIVLIDPDHNLEIL